MAFTGQITVNSLTPTAIKCNSTCKNVRVMENRGVVGWPTTDYLIFKPLNTNVPVRIAQGSAYTFLSSYVHSYHVAGHIVGYIQTVTGTTTFDQDEDDA